MLFAAADQAEAVRVTMKRIIFEGPERSQVITIVNNTPAEQTYRLGWRHFRMTPERMLVNVSDTEVTPQQKAVEDMIRFAPRRIVLPPGQRQQVRLVARRPRNLAEGEYRAHLWIAPEAAAPEFSPEMQEEAEARGGAAIQIAMMTGVSLPVFVRHGNLTAAVDITDASLQKAGDAMKLNFTINREGNRSVYGDIDFVCTGGGGEYIARQVRGIAVYTDVTRRDLEYNIPYPPEGESACRQMRIDYRAEPDDRIFKGQIMATATASHR